MTAALSMSRRQVKSEWSIKDYLDQMEIWAELPPPNVSLAIIARAHGAKFDGASRRHSSASDQEAELAQLLASIPERPNPR